MTQASPKPYGFRWLWSEPLFLARGRFVWGLCVVRRVYHDAVPYDLERTRRAYHESGLLAEAGPVGRAFLLSVETGQAVVGLFVGHVHRLAAEACAEGESVVPTNVWERTVATFDWATYEGQRCKSISA
jgi:hypothetical protein